MRLGGTLSDRNPKPQASLAALGREVLLQLLSRIGCIVEAVDFHVALIAELDHEMLLAVLDVSILTRS